MIKKISSIITILLVFPLLTFALEIKSVPDKNTTILGSGASGLGDLVVKISTWMYIILLALAVIFILLAAFYYLTAMGEPDKIGKAHKMLIWTIVAIIVAMLAWGITFVVKELVTGTTTPQSNTQTKPASGWGIWGFGESAGVVPKSINE